MIYESKTRQARLRAEIAKTKKTNEYYLDRVTQGRAIDEIRSRKAKQKIKNKNDQVQTSGKKDVVSEHKPQRRQFFQHSPTGAESKLKKPDKQDAKKSKLLSQIL